MRVHILFIFLLIILSFGGVLSQVIINSSLTNGSLCVSDVEAKSSESSITFFNDGILIGRDIPCKELESLRWFFEIKKGDGTDYSVVGIKIWLFIFLIFFILFLMIYLANKHTSKMNRILIHKFS